VKFRAIHKLAVCGFLAVAMLSTRPFSAQQLTLEGQTGGFLTPTAYVVESAKGQLFSHPAVGFHFINAATVIGNIETFSITEGIGNRGEAGYTRSVHQLGNTPAATATNAAFSGLWNYHGMNVFHAKVVGIKDGQFGPWTPGLAVGGVVRTNDHFVSGAINQLATGNFTDYTNEDIYVSVTKTWAHPPVPFLVNLGWKATNAVIFGIGGQSNRFGGSFYGGLGLPVPLTHGIVAVPSAGFTQEPRTVKGLGPLPVSAPNVPLVSGRADLPTTLDYAVRVTQREHPHFAFDIGVGHVAGNIGNAVVPTGLPAPYPPYIYPPVNLEATRVVGVGLSLRY
jgi:hypothetical protein